MASKTTKFDSVLLSRLESVRSSICKSIKKVDIPNKNCKAYAVVEKKKTQWKSIYIGSLIVLMSSIQFSLYFTSLWPYIKQVKNTFLLLLNSCFVTVRVCFYIKKRIELLKISKTIVLESSLTNLKKRR